MWLKKIAKILQGSLDMILDYNVKINNFYSIFIYQNLAENVTIGGDTNDPCMKSGS